MARVLWINHKAYEGKFGLLPSLLKLAVFGVLRGRRNGGHIETVSEIYEWAELSPLQATRLDPSHRTSEGNGRHPGPCQSNRAAELPLYIVTKRLV